MKTSMAAKHACALTRPEDGFLWLWEHERTVGLDENLVQGDIISVQQRLHAGVLVLTDQVACKQNNATSSAYSSDFTPASSSSRIK